MPPALLLGAGDQQCRRGVVDPDERQHQSRCVVGGQLLVEHHLLVDGHARRPIRAGQCGTAYPALCSSANQAFWKRTNSSSLDPGLGRAPVGRDVLTTPGPHLLAKLSL